MTNKLVDNDGTPIPGTETLTKIFGFKFTKVNAQGEAVKGAKFTLSVAKDQNGVLPNSDKYPLEVTSGANGVVKFDGLKAGSYTVTETAVADGYQDFKASFTCIEKRQRHLRRHRLPGVSRPGQQPNRLQGDQRQVRLRTAEDRCCGHRAVRGDRCAARRRCRHRVRQVSPHQPCAALTDTITGQAAA